MVIQVEHLRKAYGGREVLRDVSFRAGEGVTCLTAPSGAGKTTLLRIILGLERPDGGSVTGLDGARCAAVFQEDRLLEGRDAEDNLRFVLGGSYDRARAAALLEELGLDGCGKKPAREFSGGMRRRLALARALLFPSDLLALDEPFTGLDGENRARALSCIRKYAAPRCTLLVTHQLSDAAALSAAIVRLPPPGKTAAREEQPRP